MKTLSLLLIPLCTLVLCGCGSDPAALEVAKLRKGGDPLAARDRALAILRDDNDRMQVWRELAMTDVEIARRSAQFDVDALPYLIEGGILCAAVCDHKGGHPDKRWALVTHLAAIESAKHVTTCLNSMCGRPQRAAASGGHGGLSVRYVDPQHAEIAIRRVVALVEFMRRTPRTDQSVASRLKEVQDRLPHVFEDSDIMPSAMDGYLEKGQQVVAGAIGRAVQDLQDEGCFLYDTILHNGILP